MGDGYWKHGNGRPQPPSMTGQVAKRPRSEYEFPSGQIPDMPALFPRRDDMAGLGAIRETDSINASYDRYLRSRQMAPFGADGGRPVSGGLGGLSIFDEPLFLPMGMGDASILGKGRPIGMGERPEIPLPPDASSTLFVEGLPSNCTRREVSHVFRPFVGYKEVRLITKESRHPGGDPLVLCFVDFETPAHAATAMDALQGYKFDETDRDSANLRLQFARYPGARSGVPIVGNADIHLTGGEFTNSFSKKLHIFTPMIRLRKCLYVNWKKDSCCC